MTPIACPYCGGRIVNGADVDIQIFAVVLDNEGGWREGAWDEGVGVDYQATSFYCHTCDSEFFPPAGVKGTYDSKLDHARTPEVPDDNKQTFHHRVFWIGVEDHLVGRLIELLDHADTQPVRERLQAVYDKTRPGMIDELRRIAEDTT